MARFVEVPVDAIQVGERQRKEYGDIKELAEDIGLRGQLQPIIVTKDLVLVAGHRRLLAHKHLSLPNITAYYKEDLSLREQSAIEFAENEQRKNFEWLEQNALIVRHHQLCIEEEGPGWTMEMTAKELNKSRRTVEQHLDIRAGIEEGDVRPDTDKFNTARNQRIRAKKIRTADVYAANGLTVAATVYTPVDGIVIADFNEWAPAYDGPKFNLINCDFPYGIGSHDHAGQNSANTDKYWDSDATWEALCRTFVTYLDRFCAPSAHLIFWFPAERYCEVWTMLNRLPGFKFDPYPLVWQRGENEGIAPDTQRRPRRIYEFAFFGWRGDRPLGPNGTRANLWKAPTNRDYHPHEKSQEALKHFFEMVVAPTTRLLDPTCGCGSALRAARELDVDIEDMLGIELDEGYATTARTLLRAGFV